ncbi:hypothetical protein Tco_1163313 [Tanacetum coccineum]
MKRSRIAIVKVRWNSKRGPEFMWEREDQMKVKYPHLFSDQDDLEGVMEIEHKGDWQWFAMSSVICPNIVLQLVGPLGHGDRLTGMLGRVTCLAGMLSHGSLCCIPEFSPLSGCDILVIGAKGGEEVLGLTKQHGLTLILAVHFRLVLFSLGIVKKGKTQEVGVKKMAKNYALFIEKDGQE